jgi:adenosylcobyric acid synthase
MVQGTASNVGKTLIVAGLCRIFKQDGYRAAPFKSQNMALNSYITKDGLEIGRAQAVQAEAAGIEPTIDMNPILLKPSGTAQAQIIVQGEVFNDLNPEGYYAYKHTLAPKIKESFERLSQDFDIIVLEGAGSPAEINLKENDIVNMYMARQAKAPVLLAGDIDRGGVFASIAGTLLLFTEEERRFVKGILINKFRGSQTLLEPGLRQLEELIRKPVLGVIPYIEIDIDDEDSLTERFNRVSASSGLADIGVIHLPHIANFTDFNALSRIPGIRLRYVSHADALAPADMIIIPGTKNTMADLRWLRQTGLAEAVKKLAICGTPIFGICGGYQILGIGLEDPFNVEYGGTMEGLALLPVTTVFTKEKIRTRVQGYFAPLEGILAPLSGAAIEGYEVHMGATRLINDKDAVSLAQIQNISSGEHKLDGTFAGNIYGTYIHGIFDADPLALIKALCSGKGAVYKIPDAYAEEDLNFKAYKDKQYDILADCLRRYINMEQVYAILEEGI